MTNVGFYVTVMRGSKVGWLLGPIADHDVARMMVAPVRRLAESFDPRCAFDAFGTSSITRTDDQPLPPGVLNDRWEYVS